MELKCLFRSRPLPGPGGIFRAGKRRANTPADCARLDLVKVVQERTRPRHCRPLTDITAASGKPRKGEAALRSERRRESHRESGSWLLRPDGERHEEEAIRSPRSRHGGCPRLTQHSTLLLLACWLAALFMGCYSPGNPPSLADSDPLPKQKVRKDDERSDGARTSMCQHEHVREGGLRDHDHISLEIKMKKWLKSQFGWLRWLKSQFGWLQ